MIQIDKIFPWRGRQKLRIGAARTNEEWLASLQGDGANQGLVELRAVILQGLRIGLRGQKIRNDDLEDFTQETIIRIVEHLDSFRGDSHFTTWVHKIGLRVAFSELRRKRWKEVSLDSLLEESETVAAITPMATTPSLLPDEATSQEMSMQLVMTLIEEELTEKQRDALMAVMVHGMPMEVVAEKMGTNRNALYKMLHDARMSLRKALVARGLSLEDLLSEL